MRLLVSFGEAGADTSMSRLGRYHRHNAGFRSAEQVNHYNNRNTHLNVLSKKIRVWFECHVSLRVL